MTEELIQYIQTFSVFVAIIFVSAYAVWDSLFGRPLKKIMDAEQAFIVADWKKTPKSRNKICIVTFFQENDEQRQAKAQMYCTVVEYKSKNYLSLFTHKNTIKQLASPLKRNRYFYAGCNIMQIDVSTLHYILSHQKGNIDGLIINHMCRNQQIVTINDFDQAFHDAII